MEADATQGRGGEREKVMETDATQGDREGERERNGS